MATAGRSPAQSKPSPFQGCWDRIERANRQRDALLESFKGLPPKQVYHLPIHVDSKGAGFIGLELKPLPSGFALQFGEVLYQLRAALDGSIYAAAVLESAPKPLRRPSSLEFLVRRTFREFCVDSGRKLEPLVDTPIADIVESVQPYRALKLTDNGIGMLNDLARIDRHRRLHVVAGWPTDISLDLLADCEIVSQSSNFTGGLDGEDKVISFQLSGYRPGASQLNVEGEIIFHIGINEVAPGTILDLTRIMAGAVSDVVRRIEDCF